MENRKTGVLSFDRNDLTQWVLLLCITGGRYVESVGLIYILTKYRWFNIRVAFGVAVFLFVHAGVMCLMDGYNMAKPLQQTLLMFLYILGYSTFFRSAVPDLNALFRKYQSVCGVVSLIGIMQFTIALATGTDIFGFLASEPTVRAHSYLQEPAFLANFLTPCVLLYLMNHQLIKKNKRNFIIVFTAYFLTLATIAYVTIVLFIIYKIFKSRYRILMVALFVLAIALGGYMSYIESNNEREGYVGTMQTKVEDTASAIDYFDPVFFEGLNLSSYSTLTNLWVALHAPYRIFGTGIGTHAQNYFNTYKSDFSAYGLNSDEAYSLFSRILSEFGYIGIFLLLLFMLKYRNKQNFYNTACLFYIVALCIRGGHYTVYGFFLFTIIYYLTSNKGKFGRNDKTCLSNYSHAR